MSDRRLPVLALVTSDWVLSYRVWAISAALLGTSQVVHNAASYGIPVKDFVLPVVIAMVCILVVARITLSVLRRLSVSLSVRAYIMATAGIIAAFIDSTIMATYRTVFLDLPANVLQRGVGLSVLILTWFAIFGSLVALDEEERQDIFRLTWVRNQLARWRDQQGRSIEDLKLELAAVMEDRIMVDLGRLEGEIKALGSPESEEPLRALYEHVREHSTELVRTASRELTSDVGEVPQSKKSASSAAKRVWLIIFRARVAVAWSVVLQLIAVVASSPATDTPVALVVVVFSAIVLVAGEALWRIFDPNRTRVIGFLITVATYVGVYATVMTIGAPSDDLNPAAQSGAAAFLVAMAILASLLVELGRERIATQAQLAVQVTELEAVTAEVDRRVGQLRHQISDALHGSVQSRLAAMSLAIRRYMDDVEAGLPTDRQALIAMLTQLLTQAREDLEKVLSPESGHHTVLPDALETVAAPWKGLMQVSWEVGPGVEDACADCPALTDRLVDALRDVVTNASRHGRARSVLIALSVHGSMLGITATDDGSGPPRLDVRHGFGSRMLIEQGGSWTLRRGHRGGAVVTIDLPLVPALGGTLSETT
jgi:signal transduction histidine kinase